MVNRTHIEVDRDKIIEQSIQSYEHVDVCDDWRSIHAWRDGAR